MFMCRCQAKMQVHRAVTLQNEKRQQDGVTLGAYVEIKVEHTLHEPLAYYAELSDDQLFTATRC